jgi:hypothetical protein
MTKNGITTLRWRVEQLEKNYCDLDKKLEMILTNHLPHIHQKLSSIDTRQKIYTFINVGAIIVGILIAKYL